MFDPTRIKYLFPFLFSLILIISVNPMLIGQTETALQGEEITISPAQLYFNVDPGKEKTQTITIENKSNEPCSFRVKYQDFEINTKGDSEFHKAGSLENSISGFLSIDMETVTVAPESSVNLAITISIPDGHSSDASSWGVLMLESVNDPKVNSNRDPANENQSAASLTMGVSVFQNPSGAEDNRVDITNLIFEKKASNDNLHLKLKNRGDGISVCKAYISLTNLTTGEKSQIGGDRFTLLPGCRRSLEYQLSAKLPEGKYIAIGIIDYENDDDLVATELEFKID
jgi:hypothetical protein